jgi:voltage-gated potassium channel
MAILLRRPRRPIPDNPARAEALLRRRHRFYRHLLALCLLVMTTMVLPGRWALLLVPGYLLLTGMVSVELGGGIGGDPPGRFDLSYRLTGVATVLMLLYWLLAPLHVRFTALVLVGLVVVFYLWTLTRLVRWLAEEPQIDRLVLCGALAGYLLLGIWGGLLLCAIESFQPGSFRSALDATDPILQAAARPQLSPLSLTWEHGFMRVNYFAFVSLTTVGYGDILPVRPAAQMASLVLSIAGPLYIAVVMGLMISRLTSAANGGQG